MQVPVYLEPEVLAFLTAKAARKGVRVEQIVNDLLKRNIGIVETLE